MPFELKQPITGAQLHVAETDFHEKMSLDDAMRVCQNLGNGWRLPNIEELKVMYEQLHTKGKGNFMKARYWSNSQTSTNEVWTVDFYSGDSSCFDKDSDYRVRAVRAL